MVYSSIVFFFPRVLFYPEVKEVTIHVVNVFDRLARYRSSNCSL